MADDRVKQVKEANDIVDVVGSYLALRPAGQTFKGLCPFHEDSRPSFDVDPRRQRYRCWACNKVGDVFSFVQEFEKVGFREALELLARRAGIELDAKEVRPDGRASLLGVMRWATKRFHECLLDDPQAHAARLYVGERGLSGLTVRKYELGYAPRTGDWLVNRAIAEGISLELLETVGLIARRKNEGNAEAPDEEGSRTGFYDRFRDRVQFPIRDVRGQTVGFGGRILPSSPLASRAPKYYNSCDTPLFSKSEQLYGLDVARQSAEKVGYLAVVEGYTDVLMAHQTGIGQVVATMGTALNARHVYQLRRFAPRVVLVFDADAGGMTGVDRALGIFASNDVELSIATLPADLDPCDLLVQAGGPESFRRVLESACDALEFKLNQELAREGLRAGVEARRKLVEAVLSVIAQAPPVTGQAGAVKTQLMINRLARRLALKEETLWLRLEELRGQRARVAERHRPGGPAQPDFAPREGPPDGSAPPAPPPSQGGPAPVEERQLLEVLLAEPALTQAAAAAVAVDDITHPGLRRLYASLVELHTAGEVPSLDLLRPCLDHPRLAQKALELQEAGLANPDRATWLTKVLALFAERRARATRQELHSQLQAASDPETERELLRQIQNRTNERGPGPAPAGGLGGANLPFPGADAGIRS